MISPLLLLLHWYYEDGCKWETHTHEFSPRKGKSSTKFHVAGQTLADPSMRTAPAQMPASLSSVWYVKYYVSKPFEMHRKTVIIFSRFRPNYGVSQNSKVHHAFFFLLSQLTTCYC
jgi:hypothetical protein